jgi:RHS repeat-associated protein
MVSNLLRKVDDQSYSYDANGNVTSYEGKTLEYSVFDKPTRIQSKGHETTFKYGTARNRYERHDAYTDGKSKTTQYLGSVEKIQHSDGKLEFKRRLPGGALITLEQDSNNNILNETINYLHMDHLGSVDVITDAQGNIIQEMSFDLWGKRRDGTDWTKLGLLELSGFNADTTTRGYTGHEMLDEVGLIHMNGRVYDPRLGRFIQADSIIDGVSNTQGYGRYTYVKNNPLNATDPTGHFSLKRFVKKYWKPLVVVGLSIATYGAATSWAAGWGATWGTAATATSAATLTASGAMAVGAISGAVGGFAGGVLQAGTLRGGVKGAVSGAIAGAAGGYANFGSVGGWGDAARRVGISAVGGCGAGVASGGSCSKGARMAAMAQAVSVGIEKFSSKPTLGTPENKNGVYKLSDDKVRNQNHCFTCDVADTNSNNIGIGVRSQNANQVLGAATPDSGWLSFNEGSVASRGLAHVPGFNSGAVFHDTFVGTLERSVGMQNWSSSAQTFGGLFTNQLTIAPAIALNYYATGVQSYNYYWDNIE